MRLISKNDASLVVGLHATAETLEATLEHMKVVEEMRRTLRDIRDTNRLNSN